MKKWKNFSIKKNVKFCRMCVQISWKMLYYYLLFKNIMEKYKNGGKNGRNN